MHGCKLSYDYELFTRIISWGHKCGRSLTRCHLVNDVLIKFWNMNWRKSMLVIVGIASPSIDFVILSNHENVVISDVDIIRSLRLNLASDLLEYSRCFSIRSLA
jgi:hypothetical protein